MDDPTLAAQYAQSGDLMDLCNNEAWLRESAQVEDGVQVEAGLPMREYSQTVTALTSEQNQQLRQQMKVQSILFTALRQWMESWDLGAGFDDTYAIARRLIRHHLANPAETQFATIDRLLAGSVEPGNMNPSTEKQAVSLLAEMFTQEDWQAMAEAASHSISSRVLSAGKTQPVTTAV
jgi:hypothetical protein